MLLAEDEPSAFEDARHGTVELLSQHERPDGQEPHGGVDRPNARDEGEKLLVVAHVVVGSYGSSARTRTRRPDVYPYCIPQTNGGMNKPTARREIGTPDGSSAVVRDAVTYPTADEQLRANPVSVRAPHRLVRDPVDREDPLRNERETGELDRRQAAAEVSSVCQPVKPTPRRRSLVVSAAIASARSTSARNVGGAST